MLTKLDTGDFYYLLEIGERLVIAGSSLLLRNVAPRGINTYDVKDKEHCHLQECS